MEDLKIQNAEIPTAFSSGPSPNKQPDIKLLNEKKKRRRLGPIGLLLWKNLLVRRRHYVILLFEILLPTLFALLFAGFKAVVPTIDAVNTLVNTSFTEYGESDLARRIITSREKRSNITFIIGYAPTNNKTDEIMKAFETGLQKYRGFTKLKLRGFPSEDAIIDYNTYNGLNTDKERVKEKLRAAIVFENGFSPLSSSMRLSYKIRLVDVEFQTEKIYDSIKFPGPVSGSAGKGYQQTSGSFAAIQVFMDKAITQVVTMKSIKQKISVQAFPYPPYKSKVDFSSLITPVLPIFLVTGFIFIVPSILRKVVAEKESGIKELMKMMGLCSYQHWIGWMVDSLLVVMVSVTIVVILLFTRLRPEAEAFLVHSSPGVWWLTLMLYAMAAISFLFFLSTLFQSAIIAVSVGMVFWIVSYIALAVPLLRNYENLSLSDKMASCLLPNMGLHWAVKLMHSLEFQGFGAQWSNLSQPSNTLDDFALQHVMIMFVISSIMYNVLTMYLEIVLPSKYGLTKPWYFIFQRSFWRKQTSILYENELAEMKKSTDDKLEDGFEAEPTTLKRSVEIKNLEKTFTTRKDLKLAVDGLTLNMFEGQITVLLGCNGAGKTTLISMLTGLFGPSSGQARIYGFDIASEMNSIRKELGYCSQHDILFDKLTVRESLLFFGLLKGLSWEEASKEISTLLERLQLTEKTHSIAGCLSGGQKRKLSLAMAIIGGSKLVVMDEPTAGMDPEARRVVWDLLLEIRKSRTMLLTTHFMEEADILGDRIAIMSAGRIHCCGSTLFLKQHYGSGYTLKLSVYSSALKSHSKAILDLVRSYTPEAYWKEKLNENQQNDICDIGIALPRQNDTNDTAHFPALFAELSQRKDELGILHIGLPLTTMDEVFAKVAEETGEGQIFVETSNKGSTDISIDTGDENSRNVRTVSGLFLLLQHTQGLLIKRYLYTSRKKLLFTTQLLLPILLSIASVLVFNATIAPLPSRPALKIDIGSYKNPKAIYTTTNETYELGNFYRSAVEQNRHQTNAEAVFVNDNINNALIQIAQEDELEYRERFVIAAEFTDSDIRAMFQTIPIHASPLSINLVTNALLRNMMPSDGAVITLTVTNHPLTSGLNNLLLDATPNPSAAKNLPLIYVLLLPLGLSTLAAGFVVFPLDERLCRAKHLQLMTGIRAAVFWMSSFVWDFFLVILLTTVMIFCFPIFENYSAFTTGGATSTFFLIILVFGISAISFSYLFSLMMPSVAGGFAFLAVLNMFMGMLWTIVVHTTEQSNFFDLADNLRWVGRLFPSFGASLSLMRFVEKVGYNSKCNMVTDQVKQVVCNPNFANNDVRIFVEDYQSCCDNCADFKEHGVSCFELKPFLEWDGTAESEHISADIILPGIGQELTIMLLFSCIYLFLLFTLEYTKSRGILNFPGILRKFRFSQETIDPDVEAENKRVSSLASKREIHKDAIVVENLCKRFGTFAAVSNMNFGVHRGECYGLLGVNGAGKTTLFQMMTGNLDPTSGNVHICCRTLKSDNKLYMKQIGYCPQYDGLINCLSGQEMLELFCRLRGIHPNYIKAEAGKWLERYGLSSSANVQCGNYSGGMKRRLSAAIAMVGHPNVILLDEPTSGVDPVSRRQFWALVKAGKDAGQALILTSHSMEECEALCSRLSIMVNGQLRCTGTVQHLKSKLSPGFTLVFKLNQQLILTHKDEIRQMSEVICKAFQPCVLKEEHESVVEFRVERTEIDWEIIFSTLEKLKSNFSGIMESYSVYEASLDEIFLSIAKSKSSDRRALWNWSWK
ncbi:unnamed protein product [Allacma fusca]|uniref:ABC transporter domain-containing protein n=1 Tax=Allacma fusca TaxID=39272 RepID=A0A8J2K0B3_9HEXA|nr:unnamed protein product [Allacma fusca]